MEWCDENDLENAPPVGSGDGYLRWEARRRPAGRADRIFFHPVFVSITEENIDRVLVAATDSDNGLLLEKVERARLDNRTDVRDGKARAVVYRRADKLEDQTLYTILQIAPAIDFFSTAPISPTGEVDLQIQQNTKPGPAIFGVIDDCVPFLNVRFRRTMATTRFLAVWLQQLEYFDEQPDDRAEGNLFAGPVIEREEIDRLIGDGYEADVYRSFKRETLSASARRALTRHTGHGAHVLDLCCGDVIGGPLRDTDILAVQLPAHAVAQTDGRRLEGYAMQALRWIVERAIEANRTSNLRRPLIVNISLGVTAGRKDGNSFVEDWIKYEIERFETETGAHARVVLSYGNAWRTRQVAYRELAPGETAVLDWRIQPDDRTSNHLELRSPQALRVTLTAPGGQQVTFDPKGTPRKTLMDGVHLLSMVQDRAAAGCDDGILISVAPTAVLDGSATAPAGRWRLELTNDGREPVAVSLQIQRDDPLPDYGTGARQSYFDHPCSWKWDEETRDHTAPGDSPITRTATHAADATSSDPRILTVGAARRALDGDGYRPTRTTAAGTTNRFLTISRGPTVSALAEEPRGLPGRRATGVLSGSTARYGGTSVAAPQVARALARIDLSKHTDAVLLAPRPATPEDRLGHGVVDPDTTQESRPGFI